MFLHHCRSYHLLASGGKDSRVIVWKLSNHGMGTEEQEDRARLIGGTSSRGGVASGSAVDSVRSSGSGSNGFFNEQDMTTLLDHNSEVWKVVWNVTGTVLATSGDDGLVNLYKCSTNGAWICQQRIDSKRKLDHQTTPGAVSPVPRNFASSSSS